MSPTHDQLTTSQFAPQADRYATSPVHAQGEDRETIEVLASEVEPRRALDIGTGGGHVAFRVAKHADEVVASDLSPTMLEAVRVAATAKGLDNVELCNAGAENLPFDAAHFDFLTCRFSAHHWGDFEAGLREARRVLMPGAKGVFVDTCSPGASLLDTHLQAIELLRDASHVRNYTGSEWTGALARSGFGVRETRTWRLHMDFGSWVVRMQTPPHLQRAIRALQEGAAEEVRSYFELEPDGSFTVDVALFIAVAR